MILVAIAVPSFKLLFLQTDHSAGRRDREGDRQAVVLELQLSGQQVRVRFADAASDKERKADQPRLLAVDNEMVVPVNKVVRVQVIGADVIHAFAVPSFGIKIDAVPGRLNETWFKATREGIYYGQCSELCGKDHAFMPIAVRVVSDKRLRRLARGGEEEVRRRRRRRTTVDRGRRYGRVTASEISGR